MSNNFSLVLAFIAGTLLGVFFFGGLWWTVRKGVKSHWPAVWFLGSLLLRTSVILVGFLLVTEGEFVKLLVCFLGFLFAKVTIIARLTQSVSDDCTPVEMEARRAS